MYYNITTVFCFSAQSEFLQDNRSLRPGQESEDTSDTCDCDPGLGLGWLYGGLATSLLAVCGLLLLGHCRAGASCAVTRQPGPGSLASDLHTSSSSSSGASSVSAEHLYEEVAEVTETFRYNIPFTEL